ncbi:MAG TPA: hypothetical protein VF133_07715 [Terriglobales bacterium]
MSFHLCRAPAVNAAFLLVLLASLPPQDSPGQSTRKDASARSSGPPRNEQARKRLLTMDLHNQPPPSLPAAVVVEKLMATGLRRSAQLRGFRATRSYRLQYRGLFGTREANMKVLATYTAPEKWDFSVVSQSGSKLLLNRVLLKLIDSEREAYRNQSQIEISPANYQFESSGLEDMATDDPCYVLHVQPRHDSKFLYRGKIWVDARDFALVHMEGEPARSPSFWVKDTHIDSTWQKVSGFWFIAHNRSLSRIRMGGTATLTIDYTDYQITEVGSAPGAGQNVQLPAPSSVTPER